jgi:hypothetical protein
MREGEEKGVAPFHLAAERSLHGGGGLRHVLLGEGMEGPRGVHDALAPACRPDQTQPGRRPASDGRLPRLQSRGGEARE